MTRAFARRLGLVDESGWPRQANVRRTTVRGVVEGASEQVPLMAFTYQLRGTAPHMCGGHIHTFQP